jgi:hypothetical protein
MKAASIARQLAAFTTLAVLSTSAAFAACDAPGKPPDVPDGHKARSTDILLAQQQVVAFQSATATYLACLKRQHDDAIAAAGPSISSSAADKIDDQESTAHNAAVHQLNDLAERFNQSVQDFKTTSAAAASAAAAAKKPPDDKGKSGN